jgi:hypothetical protein
VEDERSLKRNRQVMRATGIVPALHDTPLRDREGVTVGELEDLLADAATNRPAWLVVKLDDGRRTVAPAHGSRSSPLAPDPAFPWPNTRVTGTATFRLENYYGSGSRELNFVPNP